MLEQFHVQKARENNDNECVNIRGKLLIVFALRKINSFQ